MRDTIAVGESLPTPRPINWADSARATGSDTSFAFSFLVSPIEIKVPSSALGFGAIFCNNFV